VLKVVSMTELRLEVLLEPERTGDSVATVCRRHGISRQTYDRCLARYLRTYPRRELHIVVDNNGAHKHPEVEAWLAEHPRVTLDFARRRAPR
jgi:transposase-like protein